MGIETAYDKTSYDSPQQRWSNYEALRQSGADLANALVRHGIIITTDQVIHIIEKDWSRLQRLAHIVHERVERVNSACTDRPHNGC